MKYTIEGFSQEAALNMRKEETQENGKQQITRIDCIDLVILRWIVDFYPQMEKIEINGAQYAWVNYKALLEDMPLLDMKKRMLEIRLKKLVDFEILTRYTSRENGTWSYYGFGRNYFALIEGGAQNIADPSAKNCRPPAQNIADPLRKKLQTKDPSTIDPSTTDSSIKRERKAASRFDTEIAEIIAYLNEKAGTSYRPDTKETVRLLNGLLGGKFPYTVDQIKTVIDKKCSEWRGTEFEQYLRPSTLFGSKFESYLNARAIIRQQQQTAAPKAETENERLRREQDEAILAMFNSYNSAEG